MTESIGEVRAGKLKGFSSFNAGLVKLGFRVSQAKDLLGAIPDAVCLLMAWK